MVDGLQVAVLVVFDLQQLADFLPGLLDLFLQGRQVRQLLMEIHTLNFLGLFH